jgi:hypothetical protein
MKHFLEAELGQDPNLRKDLGQKEAQSAGEAKEELLLLEQEEVLEVHLSQENEFLV